MAAKPRQRYTVWNKVQATRRVLNLIPENVTKANNGDCGMQAYVARQFFFVTGLSPMTRWNWSDFEIIPVNKSVKSKNVTKVPLKPRVAERTALPTPSPVLSLFNNKEQLEQAWQYYNSHYGCTCELKHCAPCEHYDHRGCKNDCLYSQPMPQPHSQL